MFIEELELIGYDRLNLNQFEKIHLKFTKKVQVILGTNGSGKSSLLAELTPLPAEAKNYSKTGSKKIIIRKSNKRYILKSSFNPTIHSFFDETTGEELNPGGTITIQRDLVKKIFKIDATTHALTTGKKEFHSMHTSVKREWFRLLSDSNFDYPIKVFNKIKEANTHNTGALKLARNKLVAQSSMLMPSEELKVLHDDCNELYKIVELLINNRNTPTANPKDTENEIKFKLDSLEREARGTMNSILELERLLSLGLVDKVEDAPSLIFFVSNKLEELKTKKNNLFEESKRCREILQIYEKTKLSNVATISTNIENLKTRKKQIESELIYNFNTVDPRNLLEILEIVSPKLLDLSHEIPINENSTKYTRDKYKNLVAAKETLQREIDVNSANINNYNERLEHHDNHKDSPDVTCPRCELNWKPFYNENAVNEIKKKIDKATEEIKFKRELIEDLDIQIKEFNHWVSYVDLIKEQAQEYAFMIDFWSLIMKKEILFENPRSIYFIIQNYKNDLQNEKLIQEINLNIQQEFEKLNIVESSQGLDYNQALITEKRIADELIFIANEEQRLNSMKDVANQLAFYVKKLQPNKDNLIKKEEEIKELTERFIEDNRRIMFNNILRSFQSDLAIKEKAINDEKMHETILKSLQNEITTLELNTEAYKAVLKELSPVEGIIAEGLFGYMKLFIRNMNKFIASVWSYPLIVHPCKSEEGKIELDYLFPLTVKNKTRNDVSDGSSSMGEIIDLSFIVCAMKSIGLGNAPLFLDEFGSAMDPVHKQQTARMIANIVDGESFSQVFLISHDVAQYGSLDNTEVCLLNASNVIIPDGCVYNQHVTFE